MNTTAWRDANQHYLMAAIRAVREMLERYQSGDKEEHTANTAQDALDALGGEMPTPAALDILTTVFRLSLFERNVLLLCAGVELDSNFSALVANIQGSPVYCLPSFGLALAALPGAHWSALSPDAPLRYWRLLELTNDQLISQSPLKIDEQILHYLAGVHQLDGRLTGTITPVVSNTSLVPSHLAVADKILQCCTEEYEEGMMPVIQLTGDNKPDKEEISAYVATRLGMYLYNVTVHAIPVQLKEMLDLARIWNREAALKSCVLQLDYTDLDLSDKSKVQAVNTFIENIQGLLIVSCAQATPRVRRRVAIFDAGKPTTQEQYFLWQHHLGEIAAGMNGHLHSIVSQFNLDVKTIRTASAQVLQQVNSTPADVTAVIWKSCCAHTRPHVDELAQRITPMAGWDDIILPEAQKDILREMAMQVKQRNKVYDDWGFAARSARGLGISALFAGESGTGKTMASEVLANALQLDLYRIDLSQVINKYVGETEKNLKLIFDAAEEGGAILLFDEADALFGKRSDVKDSHDRYANIEVSYLLQRMEAYRGLAILTTNMKSSMDKAWMRRIRFIIQFPFPDAAQRADIWRRVFPPATPVSNIDADKLSKLSIAGGNIRNIALNAAFIAADENRPVDMSHILRAARSEYMKLEKSFTPL